MLYKTKGFYFIKKKNIIIKKALPHVLLRTNPTCYFLLVVRVSLPADNQYLRTAISVKVLIRASSSTTLCLHECRTARRVNKLVQ